jgi:hypothetical protein
MDEFSIDNQAGAYQIHALPGRSRTSSSSASKETPPSQETEPMDGFSMDQQAGDYQIHALPGRSRTSSSPAMKETPPQETEVVDRFSVDNQAGAYRIMPLPGKATEGAETPTIDFDAGGEAMDDVTYEVTGGSGRGGGDRGVLVFGDDEEVGQHNFADAAGGNGTNATIVEASQAATKVAKEAADDVVAAGSKLL